MYKSSSQGIKKKKQACPPEDNLPELYHPKHAALLTLNRTRAADWRELDQRRYLSWKLRSGERPRINM